MLTRIQARNYRCLKHVDQQLSHFDILVGGNGVGKSTFLDVIGFLGEVVAQPRDGLESALKNRCKDFWELLFDVKADSFELAIEAQIPLDVAERNTQLVDGGIVRYQVRVGRLSPGERTVGVISEKLLIRKTPSGSRWKFSRPRNDGRFPSPSADTILEAEGYSLTDSFDEGFSVIGRNGQISLFQYEVPSISGSLGFSSFRLGNGSLGLANLPDDSEQFPVATWIRRILADGVVALSHVPGRRQPRNERKFSGTYMDGELNLPELICQLKKTQSRFNDWLNHIKVALSDVSNIEVVETPQSNSPHIELCYNDGRKVPSWLLSDGTLRLLSLTLPAYAMDDGRILLIEEPENCIHPLAIEVVMQSLNSMYESQVFVTTHSPAILSLAEPENILCFSKTVEEGTSIVRGTDHPRLSEWKKSIDLGTLLASGILG